MRLSLSIPEASTQRDLDADRSLVVLAGPGERPLATLTLHHPRAVPMSVLEWASDVTRGDLPTGTTASVLSSRVDTNQVGWTMQVVHSVVTRAAEPAPVEIRLTAIFRFESFTAAAVARVHEPARFDEVGPQILELFQTARPDWNGPEIASLSQLYD